MSNYIDFCKLSQKEKCSFFIKYFQYIKAIYGREIYEILNEIEQNINTKLYSNIKSNSRR